MVKQKIGVYPTKSYLTQQNIVLLNESFSKFKFFLKIVIYILSK